MANDTQFNILTNDQITALNAARYGVSLAQVVRVFWPSPDGVINYAFSRFDLDPAFTGATAWLAGAVLNVSLIPDDVSRKFIALPNSSAVGDDTISLRFFNDASKTIEKLLYKYQEGVRVEVYVLLGGQMEFTPLKWWVGTMRAPTDSEDGEVRVTADAGFNSPDCIVPSVSHATECPFYFAPLLDPTERAQSYCDYNKDLGGARGLNDPATGMPFTDCDYTRNGCFARMGDFESYGGDETVLEATQIGGGSHTTTSIVEGNESFLKEPMPVVLGYFRVKNRPPLAVAREEHPDPKHKDKGTLRTLTGVSWGPIKSYAEADTEIMGNPPQGSIYRLGTLRQAQTAFSPNVGRYSWRAIVQLNVNPINPKTIQNSQIVSDFTVEGHAKLPIYTDSVTVTYDYSRKRAWAYLLALTDPLWGLGWDPDTRLVVDDFIKLAATNRNFDGVLTGATIQTLVRDFTQPAGWLSFFYGGMLRTIELKKIDLDDADVPTFTDAGSNRNILRIEEGDQKGVSRLKVYYKDGKRLFNSVKLVWYDEGHSFIERPTIFADKKLQIKAGRVFGDRTKRKVEVTYHAAGITSLAEIASSGAMYRDIGPSGEGGLLNNLEVVFYSSLAFPEAANMHPGKVFKLFSNKLTLPEYKDINGNVFEAFRCKKVVLNSAGEIEITAQAYGEAFWNNRCEPLSGWIHWPTGTGVMDGQQGSNVLFKSESGTLSVETDSFPDAVDTATVQVYRWEHTVLQIPVGASYNVWDGFFGFKVWNQSTPFADSDITLWVFHEGGPTAIPASTVRVKSGDKLSVEFDKTGGTNVWRFKINGVLLHLDSAAVATPINTFKGITFGNNILIGPTFWEMFACAPIALEPGTPGGGTTTSSAADSAAVLVDRLFTDESLLTGTLGFNFGAAAKVSSGVWASATIYVDRGGSGTFVELATTSTQAKLGKAISVLPGTTIGTEIIQVELQPGQILTSYSPAEIAAGKGFVYAGGEVFQYATAAQLDDDPNQWQLSGLTNRGARCTTAAKATHALNEPFMLLDEAVVFVPMDIADIGQTYNFKVVTGGFAVADATAFSFTFHAPNYVPTTPADYNLAYNSVTAQVVHDWTPISDSCLVTVGLVYEIREDDGAGAPGTLIFSGNASDWSESYAVPGVRTYHFRAKTAVAAGAYIISSIAISAGDGGTLIGEPLIGEGLIG